MEILIGRSNRLANGVVRALARYRHRIFIDRLGWNLTGQHGLELDQFDNEETIYAVVRNSQGEVVGSARLLTTERPYLLSEIFPQLMGGIAPPCDPHVWELSRFAATDISITRDKANSQFRASVVVELLDAVFAEAARHGVQRIITVSPMGVERLLRRYGFEVQRAGPAHIIDGRPVLAFWIEVGQSTLRICTDQ
ncbi:N-acylhomoserine lactone synthase [Achromobacter sp. Root83]|uniref:acyl-homoserine-lactone synthase n=1 Tax=Achromobacter sp. Root83 TaxID=1736602 RepID=UPI00071036B7|nr:acyl-homoserine-lactone synthase [Achromobacter sp. Root83]KRC69211.1 N-acylhomoserine lactone synthase [Achromobacter sp. Root83]